MVSPGSVSHWIQGLKRGDDQAGQNLWERYFARLVDLARTKLRGTSRRVADEEDIALSAFHSLCAGAARGRFPLLSDRDNLWRLLVVITARKAADQLAHARRAKRGGGLVRGESALRGQNHGEGGVEQIIGQEPTPEFAAQVAEEYTRLLDRLGDETLRKVAVWKMEGYTNDEIAGMLECARRTVARKLELIRKRLEERPR
jgi:DNA-directed RNA polymerase specialized sigma24 family protein